MKMQLKVSLYLGAILAFASSGNLFAAPSLLITKPPVVSTMGPPGPPIDPSSVSGQWFKDKTTGAEEYRTHEFHDNVPDFGGGPASYGAIRGVVTSITYVAGPGSDIIAFKVLATITNDSPGFGAFEPGDNSHGETNPAPVIAQTYMTDTKLVAEFAISEPLKYPMPAFPPYRDPGYMSYIIAENEEQWAWYCWSSTNEFGPAGDYYVPTWDFGTIPPGGSASKTLVFTVDPPMPPGPPPFGTPDPRYMILVDSEEFGHDIFANRTTSLKISTWIDNLYFDFGAPYYPEEEVLRGSDVSVFHNIAEPGADWGDAPDSIATPMYPTLAINGGAYHEMTDTNKAWLGHFWDAETNGIPSPIAVGDDFDAENDEDGIAFTSPLVPGSAATLDVVNITTNGSYLQGWIDFSGDKDWADAGEMIFTDIPMSMGPTSLVFSVPPGAVGGETFARFRLSSVMGLGFTGGAPDGEVEDYRVIIVDGETEYDFGDAPDPLYPTLVGSGGAGHAIVPAFLLGGMVDPEFNGQPTPAADGDDITGTDEDGVTFTSDIIAGKTNTVDVIIVSPPTGGLLDAWIDFNGDGDWFDSGEQIFASTPLVPGLNPLSFTAPDPVGLGTSYARFRLSTAGGLAPIGMAPDGEVEDYRIELYQPAPINLVITNLAFTASNTIANVKWDAQTNILYQLQATTNLVVSNSWANVGPTVLGPANLQVNPASTTQKFYRVVAPWAK